MIDAVHALDSTRPVTMALASLAMSDAVGLPALLDVVGYNYQETRYPADHAQYPKRVIFGSENTHTYGNWTIVRDNAFVAGQFLWTGIDYLGEAGAFPNHANGAGLLDLAGFKKPTAWFRQSLWSDTPMVYLAAAPRRPGRLEEHWNWPGGSTVAVSAYTNAEEVALTLNDQSLATKSLATGVLKAVARTKGQAVAEFALTTAGAATRLELIPDRTRVDANGDDVVHVEYRIVDQNGVRVPNATAEVTFGVEGPARLLGIGNGDLDDTSSNQSPTHRVFHGRGLAILQSTTVAGAITIRASAPNLQPALVTVTAVGKAK
jgi:beta-galactosidase